MQLRITINLDGDAFYMVNLDDEPVHWPYQEIEGILDVIKERIMRSIHSEKGDTLPWTLHDSNGNTCGAVEVTE